MATTRRCTAAIRQGRLGKAEEFLNAAETIAASADDENDIGDAYVTLCVHAGIAAADVVCCARLGEHAQGTNHNEAKALLRRVDKGLADDLGILLSLKTDAGYSAKKTSADNRKRAERAAQRLVDAATEMG